MLSTLMDFLEFVFIVNRLIEKLTAEAKKRRSDDRKVFVTHASVFVKLMSLSRQKIKLFKSNF